MTRKKDPQLVKKTQVSVYLEEDLITLLKQEANSKRVSVASLLKSLLLDHFKEDLK